MNEQLPEVDFWLTAMGYLKKSKYTSFKTPNSKPHPFNLGGAANEIKISFDEIKVVKLWLNGKVLQLLCYNID